MADEPVIISQEAIDELMRDENGPVGDLMRDLARQMATVAREKVAVRVPGSQRTGRTSSARAPGFTKSHITYTVGHSKLHNGYVFGGAEAPGNPGIFLEAPAVQMEDTHPFLTTGLWSVHLD
jgi:hypothetical protein